MCNECRKGLEDKYNPNDFEEGLYQKWEQKEYFKPKNDKDKESYCIVMPPPNVTGKLHMGHALDQTIQDILTRYKRMKGFNTLWLPGTDHAAIATEMKIVEKLKKKGIEKSDLTREQFLEKAWEWKKQYGGEIVEQAKKLGGSCDWSRERFTMDEGLSKAVYRMFKDLYDRGLIYKGKRMINWCPGCNTSISDAEMEHEEEKGNLWHIKYQITGTKDFLVVATTRPETMLGDRAVAVHPDDERYQDVIGKTCILPIMNKEIPIIADKFVEKEFGTGCVKITPAHDVNDYQAGLDHNLEFIEVFDENSKMKDLVPEYEGMDILEARKEIVKRLEELGVLIKIEDYIHNVGKCYRCKSTIEPRISDQWFVKMEPLAKPAIEAVKTDQIKFVPKNYEKTYFHWMDNTRDWCISRQLWWGHRIPAYYCTDCGEITVSETQVSECSKCKSINITQDEDTLDTWFSSALWPFSTLGWPDKTDDLKYFYPTNTLVTGYDIITFWVSRMIFSGLDQVGQIPFDTVLIHGIVRDAQGRKMSKSLGNGIDPLDIIKEYGADALRFSLVLGITPGNDIRYMPEKLDLAKNFANKLWNASKFVLMNLEDYEAEPVEIADLCYEDKWILSKLNQITKEITNNIDKFDLGVACQKIYDFIWNEFCDWYIEIVKTRLYDKENPTRKACQYTLNKVLMDSLKLLHPIMPFITEKIYLNLYHTDESIMISEWPEYEKAHEFTAEEQKIEKIKEIIIGIRNLRTNLNVHPSKKTDLIFVTKDYKELLEQSDAFMKRLGFGSNIIIQQDKQNINPNAMSVLTDGLELYIPSEELVDIEAEKQRLKAEQEKLENEVDRATKMLSNPGFVNKAPEAKIKEEKEKLAKYEEMLKIIKERLENI